ncbi:MAG: hypothetical protein ACYCUM_03870 [Solirubrobacteraceae bacterium]
MSDFPYLDGLGSELVAAASRASVELASAPSRASRFRLAARGPLALIGSGLTLLGATAVALAATGILTGSPVRTRHPSPPRTGVGAPIASSARLLPISFPDPGGGLPWGVRSFRTTRGMTCLQIGRLYDGRVGALVRGRFRPFSLSLASVPTSEAAPQPGPVTVGGCRLPGETFATEMSNVPASGIAVQRRRGARAARPKAADVRWMAFGLLGATGRSATYELGGRLHTVPVAAGSGAFLIVLPAGPYSEPLSAGLLGGGVSGDGGPINPGSPNGPVRHFTYEIRGHTCLVSRRGTDTCRGWTKQPAPVPATGRLHRPVHVVAGRVRSGGGSLLVSFRAPYAITSAASDYEVIAPAGCDPFGQTVHRDVKKGEVLDVRLDYVPDIRRCGTRMRVQVVYTSSVVRAAGVLSTVGGVIVGEAVISTPT